MKLKGILFPVLLAVFGFAGALNISAEDMSVTEIKPKNIIFMIGDGMGPNYLAAYRYFKHGDSIAGSVGSTVFDEHWVGVAKTYPHDETVVTDSAASGTALSTGVKTYNGAVGVGTDQQSLATWFELAKREGKSTGLAVSSPITHATPASFYAHQKKRNPQEPIADDFIDNKVNDQFVVDVAFGGGTDFFIREDRNVVNELQKSGFSYIDDIEKLGTLTRMPTLGLFGAYGLPSAIERETSSLAKMTNTALRLLSKNEKGFVLMVEGSQIDWCGHANDIACAMAEMQDFENAVESAMAFAKDDGHTLVVITADHETGGLSISADEASLWKPSVIKRVHISAATLAKNMKATDGSKDNIENVWSKHIYFNLQAKELDALVAAYSINEDAIAWVIKDVINTRSSTGWTTVKHTALDVPVMAFGMGSEHFYGVMENTYIGQTLHRLVKP